MGKQIKHSVSLGAYDKKGFFIHERTVKRAITSKKKLVRYKNARYIVVNDDWKYAVLEKVSLGSKTFKTSFNYDIHNY